jgi:hypothetical protein
MAKITKERRAELEADRARLEDADRAMLAAYPRGGHQGFEDAMKAITDRLREIKGELEAS